MHQDLTPQDIVNCYRLVFGRDPESNDVIEEKLRQRRADMLPDLFGSSEYIDLMRPKLVSGSLSRATVQLLSDDAFRSWVAEFSPLSPSGAEAVLKSDSWSGLYHALFSDALFAQVVLTDPARETNAAFVGTLAMRKRLEAASRIEGRIDLVTPHEIHGWAVDKTFPERRLGIELWIEDEFAAAAVTQRYRPDLQARYGGDGQVGFVLARPLLRRGGGPQAAELREATSGTVVEAFELSPTHPAPMDDIVALRRELAQVREQLGRMESRLPNVNEAFSFRLEAYGDYFDTYYASPVIRQGPPAPLAAVTVLVDGGDVSPGALDAALASLHRQGRCPAQVLVIPPLELPPLDCEHVFQAWREKLGATLLVIPVRAGWTEAMAQAVEAVSQPHVMLLRARSRLAPDAVEIMARALQSGARLAYADSDLVQLRPDAGEGRHHTPSLRSGFDAELLLQRCDLGDLLGVPRVALGAFDWRSTPGPARLHGWLLQVAARGDGRDIVHIPRVLSHNAGDDVEAPAALQAQHAVLDEHLRAFAPGAVAEPHRDAFGACVAGACRVRRPLKPGVRAAIIVPTRDRVDLLAPCLTSIQGALEHNRAEMEVLVVDNRSQEPQTRDLLDRFARTLPLRVLDHDGTFNWALVNNRAASQTEADVLVFLNNDTVVMTPDWCDELCSQAMRPDVGAVGARLLYGDGTIQHAGVVTGGWHAFAAHEGVGAPGRDPGYLGRHALLREVAAVTGACLATARTVFEGLGGFDALGLPVEGNDIDYCFRARAAGAKVLYDPYCTLYHLESKSRGLNTDPVKWAQAEAAGRLMRARWEGVYARDGFYNAHFDRRSAPFTRLEPPPAPPNWTQAS